MSLLLLEILLCVTKIRAPPLGTCRFARPRSSLLLQQTATKDFSFAGHVLLGLLFQLLLIGVKLWITCSKWVQNSNG